MFPILGYLILLFKDNFTHWGNRYKKLAIYYSIHRLPSDQIQSTAIKPAKQ